MCTDRVEIRKAGTRCSAPAPLYLYHSGTLRVLHRRPVQKSAVRTYDLGIRFHFRDCTCGAAAKLVTACSLGD